MAAPNPKRIAVKHGGGGPAMRRLIEDMFVRGGAEPGRGRPDIVVGLAQMDDGAALRLGDRYLVFTTDSHVISPRFFPGGDIGRLSIAGTINDLAMMGATDVLGLSCAMILEEGFPIEELQRVQDSIAATCREAEAPVLTGDTKVMGKGELDGMVVNTSGVGLADRVVSDAGLRPGDRILVSGTVGDHGLAVLAVRNNLQFEGDLRSDVAPLCGLIKRALLAGGDAVTAMKDPTRGGVCSTLSEMAAKGKVGVLLEEAKVPVRDVVRAAADILGIDPLHVANEGKAVLGVRADAADAVLAALRSHPLGADAAIIGTALAEHVGAVILDTGVGRRLLTELDGEPLPRIC